MKHSVRLFFGAVLVAGAAMMTTVPASAGVSVGISFGWDRPDYVPFSDSCAYYDYYDAPPPWGLPPDYCAYPVYTEPVFWDGTWYRGPIYYRWDRGVRVFWLNGGWHRNGWRGGPAPAVQWREDVRWRRAGWHGGPDGWWPRHGWHDDRRSRDDRRDFSHDGWSRDDRDHRGWSRDDRDGRGHDGHRGDHGH